MKRLIWFGAALLLTGTLLVAATAAAWLLWGAPFDHTTFTLNGETLRLDPWHSGSALASIGATVLAAAVLLLVVPVAVIVPLLIAAAVLLTVLAVLAGVLALVFSPLLLLAAVGWLAWLIWRQARRSASAATTPLP